jgi:hypothetical protein
MMPSVVSETGGIRGNDRAGHNRKRDKGKQEMMAAAITSVEANPVPRAPVVLVCVPALHLAHCRTV